MQWFHPVAGVSPASLHEPAARRRQIADWKTIKPLLYESLLLNSDITVKLQRARPHVPQSTGEGHC